MASGVSILAIILALLPCWVKKFLISTISFPVFTKDIPKYSTPFFTPNSMSFQSFSVRAGRLKLFSETERVLLDFIFAS